MIVTSGKIPVTEHIKAAHKRHNFNQFFSTYLGRGEDVVLDDVLIPQMIKIFRKNPVVLSLSSAQP